MATAASTTIQAAFVAAQSDMDSPRKTAENPHFHSKFAPLDEVLRCAKDALKKHGLAVSQPAVTDDQGRIGVQTLLIGHGEQMCLGTLTMSPPNDPQKVGSLLTYFRRYALASALGLAAEDDDDGNAASAPTRASDAQVSAVFGKARALAMSDEALFHAIARDFKGKDHPADLTASEVKTLLDKMQAAIEKEAAA